MMNESRSLIESLISEIKKLKVSEFPIRELPIVQENTDCLDIFGLIIDNDPPIVIVVNEKNEYIGIVTLLDLLSFFATSSSDLHDALSKTHIGLCIEVRDLLKAYLPIIYDDDNIAEVAQLMIKYETTFLPRAHSKNDKTILGIILLRDIVKKFRDLKNQLPRSET